ncbi:MAG TPA: DUF488 domain-containing protein [Thermoanaerobaculia bacterium]
MLFAIGYQGRSVQGLCEELAQRDVEVLIDVRERAWSNRPEFRKTALAQKLAAAGIEYQHIRDAGNPFRPRGGTTIDREECLSNYQSYLTNNPKVLTTLLHMLTKRSALFCYESHTANCHRGVLIAELARTYPALSCVEIE